MNETADISSIVMGKAVHGGLCLGAMPDGRAALITRALPGETVRVELERVRRSYVTGRAVEILKAAPERIEPTCPHYEDCGGCDLQHADYSAQIAMKSAIVRENLERAGIEVADDLIAPPLPAPKTFGYRHRLRLHVAKNGTAGFFQRRTSLISPVTRCPVATAGINAALVKILAHAALRSFIGKNAKELELAQCPQSGRITLLLHAKKPFGEQQRRLGALLFAEARVAECVFVGQFLPVYQRVGCEPVLSQTFRLDSPDGAGRAYTLSWPAGAFFQTNCRQNENLVAMVQKAVGEARPASVLDLFCGTGNFSIPPALSGARVLGVENNRFAVEWAQKNAEAAGLADCRFLCADAATEPARLLERGERFDVVILDPPRQGLGRAAALLPQLGPRRIVSISCDPATHARDLKMMLAGGCRLLSLAMVDMFPQTHHIETVAVLEGAG